MSAAGAVTFHSAPLSLYLKAALAEPNHLPSLICSASSAIRVFSVALKLSVFRRSARDHTEVSIRIFMHVLPYARVCNHTQAHSRSFRKGFIDGRELVEPLSGLSDPRNEFHIQLVVGKSVCSQRQVERHGSHRCAVVFDTPPGDEGSVYSRADAYRWGQQCWARGA